jgi:biopolymer transport protein ExbD
LEKNSIMIAVTENGQVVYGGREIGVAGVQPIIKRMLQKEQMPVIVQTDQTVPASLLVQVIDEAKLAGADKVSIATRRQSG